MGVCGWVGGGFVLFDFNNFIFSVFTVLLMSIHAYLFSCQLAIECGVGVAVLVRCFVDKKATQEHITERLGDGFSRAPFITVVVCLMSNFYC